jgi:hypothetical protein
MAQAPMPMPSPNGAAGGIMPPDPTAGAGDDTDSSGSSVICTISSDGQGGYLVYAGDESPDSDDGDMSADDDDAMGPAGDAPAGGGMGAGASAPQGQPASSVGEALKIALTIMQSAASSAGGSGSPDDQFAAGFSGSQSPTPATSMKQKF